MATLYVTADGRFVKEGSPEAAFLVASCDIDRLGLREAYEDFTKPKKKAMPKPSDKMVRKAQDK